MSIKVYHGSKTGLLGEIMPSSRAVCDFGRGFYMGDTPQQPLTLICRTANPHFYELDLNLEGLTVHRFKADIDWTLFVAFNRGHLALYSGTPLDELCEKLAKGEGEAYIFETVMGEANELAIEDIKAAKRQKMVLRNFLRFLSEQLRGV